MGGIGGCWGITVVEGVEVGGAGGASDFVVAVVVVLDVEPGWEDTAAAEVVNVAIVLEEAIVISLIPGTEEATVGTGPESCGFEGPILSFSSSGLKKLRIESRI